MILELTSVVLIAGGLLFFFGAVIGILRFPDFYTRMHAAGKGDTLSSFLILLGFAVYELRDFSWPSVLVALKIVGIGFFIMLTSPTSTHVLMEAGFDDRIQPWRKGEKSK
jgi:multicomponent Na+:H+ antiporter subunit G